MDGKLESHCTMQILNLNVFGPNSSYNYNLILSEVSPYQVSIFFGAVNQLRKTFQSF